MRFRNNKNNFANIRAVQAIPNNAEAVSDVVGVSQKRIVGVSKLKSGIYGARICYPLTKKESRLGVFDSEEEAAKAYMAKKEEFKKEVEATMRLRNNKNIVANSRAVQIITNNAEAVSDVVGVFKLRSGRYGARIRIPLTNKWLRLGVFDSEEEAVEAYMAKKEEFKRGVEATMRVEEQVNNPGVSKRKFVGVYNLANGKYGARITYPVTRKELRLGVFDSEEEAYMAYLAKKEEFRKEVEATKRLKNNPGVSPTKFVGVHNLANGKYGARIQYMNKEFRLGVFNSEEEAFEAYLAKKEEFKKEEFKKEVNANHGVSQTKFVGVYYLGNGKYDARITHPLTNKRLRLGVFDAEEEAGNVYLAKIAELREELQATPGVFQQKFVGITKLRDGKYGVRITNPSTKKRVRVGSFNTEEEALKVYLAKKEEWENELQGKKAVQLVECKDEDMKINVDNQMGPISIANRNDPCSGSPDSLLKIEPSGSSDQETASTEDIFSEENIYDQKNDGSAENELIIVSSVQSLVNSGRCSRVEVLLRTKSGTPLMDSNGFLLGNWSWIDDLSFPIV